jgi:hypothetical protein
LIVANWVGSVDARSDRMVCNFPVP